MMSLAITNVSKRNAMLMTSRTSFISHLKEIPKRMSTVPKLRLTGYQLQTDMFKDSFSLSYRLPHIAENRWCEKAGEREREKREALTHPRLRDVGTLLKTVSCVSERSKPRRGLAGVWQGSRGTFAELVRNLASELPGASPQPALHHPGNFEPSRNPPRNRSSRNPRGNPEPSRKPRGTLAEPSSEPPRASRNHGGTHKKPCGTSHRAAPDHPAAYLGCDPIAFSFRGKNE